MKRAKLIKVRWSYVAYPPNYNPREYRITYTKHRTLNAAKRAAVKFGPGSEIIRTRHAWYSDHTQLIHSPAPHTWIN